MRPEWFAGCPLAGTLDAEERRGLRRFEMLCRNFARLERLVEGVSVGERCHYAGSAYTSV